MNGLLMVMGPIQDAALFRTPTLSSLISPMFVHKAQLKKSRLLRKAETERIVVVCVFWWMICPCYGYISFPRKIAQDNRFHPDICFLILSEFPSSYISEGQGSHRKNSDFPRKQFIPKWLTLSCIFNDVRLDHNVLHFCFQRGGGATCFD